MVLGEGMKNLAASPQFADNMGMSVGMSVTAKAGWKKGKGWYVFILLETTKGMSLGDAGNSPLAIELKQGDKVLTFLAGTESGMAFGS